MRYIIYQIQCGWKKVDRIYSTSGGAGHDINNAHFCASFWSQEDQSRGHKYEVREWK